MAVYNATPHHTTPHHTTLLPEYRIAFIDNFAYDVGLNWLRRCMCIRDKELFSRFVIDEENPDYVIATAQCLGGQELCKKLKHYLVHNKESIFIFFTYECVDPDMNVFDYAFTWNPDLYCGDRIIHNVPYLSHNAPYVLDTEEVRHQNDLTPDDARKILTSNPGFCNFIYSHSSEPRDSFFHLLSHYKHVDSFGAYLNNTNTQSTRFDSDWYTFSIKMKSGYKFSIAMENAIYNGYTSEKIISSLQAHTVPIYWGNPRVSDYINPKAFINCHDYSSLDEVVERVKEIDNDDELWLDMVTQPWQTEEQQRKTANDLAEYDSLLRNIFAQDIKKARRRPTGLWADAYQKGFSGFIGVFPDRYINIARRIRRMFGKLVPAKMKPAVKKFLHLN